MFTNFEKLFQSSKSIEDIAVKFENDGETSSAYNFTEILKNELCTLKTYFSEFFNESSDAEFNKVLLNNIELLADEITKARLQKLRDEAGNELDELLNTLNDQNQDSSKKGNSELDFKLTLQKKVDVFFDTFLSRNFKSLSEISDELNLWSKVSDGGKYCLSEKDSCNNNGRTKIENAVKSFAYHDSFDQQCALVPTGFIALFDTTAFGSATDGILFTQDSIYCKGLWEDRKHFRVEEIKNIRVRDDELIVNNVSFRFYHSEVKSRLKLVVDAINEYVNQPSYKLKRYIKNKKMPYDYS